MKSLKSNTSIIVLDGDDVKEHPSKNCVMSNPSTTQSARMDIELVHRMQQGFSKINESIDIKTFIASFYLTDNH